MAWKKVNIITSKGEHKEAQSPIIISASRSTDIPAFYSDWFFHRLDEGYLEWTNPFNRKKIFISFEDTRLIVFWSKNPQPLIQHLGKLKTKKINTYIQYTLNDYENEKLEASVPILQQRIDTFKKLVDTLGFGKVIWRFDPLLLSDAIDIYTLLDRIENIGNQLAGYTEKLVFSFIDIKEYKKVENNLNRISQKCREFTMDEIKSFTHELVKLNSKWGFALATCGEKINLDEFGILHNKCIDDDLIIKLFPHDKKLMDFLNVKIIDNPLLGEYRIEKTKTQKDKGQREVCGCIVSKDIGEYNTCPHQCEYCYANTSKEIAHRNYQTHLQSPFATTITAK